MCGAAGEGIQSVGNDGMGHSVNDKPRAVAAQVTAESLIIDLSNGRSVTVPLEWFPRLLRGSSSARANWQLIGEGEVIQWPELDEGIRVEALLGKVAWR
jgi:hypothetical protein